jgi:hypothetical protein
MRKICFGLALTMAALPLIPEVLAQDAAKPAQDFVVIHMERNVDRPAQLVWSRVGGYCQIEAWFGTKCVFTTGNGDIGTNRQLNGTTNELMVAKTPLSYAYAQPASPIFYHGNLAVEVVDSGHSRIVYDLLYDAAPLATPEAKAADMAKRKQRFEAGIDKMVQIADAP